MLNPQLLDYIVQQLKQDVSKEEIKKTLIANGWQEQDIEEAFSLASTSMVQSSQSPPPPIIPMSIAQQTISTLPSAPKILKEAWAIYKARFGVFMGIGIIPALVVGAIIALLTAGEFLTSKFVPSTSNPGALIALAAASLGAATIVFLLYFWSQTALAYAVKDEQEKIGVREAYKRGWHKIISYWWISILIGFIIMGGFLLLFIPGVIFAVWFSLSIFILIAEGQKGMNALLKSKEYVKGKWWSVLGRLLFIGILVSIISLAIVVPLVIFKIPYGQDIASFIAMLFIAPLSFSYLFLIYKHLKNLKGEISNTCLLSTISPPTTELANTHLSTQ